MGQYWITFSPASSGSKVSVRKATIIASCSGVSTVERTSFGRIRVELVPYLAHPFVVGYHVHCDTMTLTWDTKKVLAGKRCPKRPNQEYLLVAR